MKTRTIKIPSTLFRSGSFEAGEGDTLRLSISSDEPYERFDWMADENYLEVLDHSPGGVDLTRLKNGAALLYNHDRSILLGTLSNPECIDGRCYVTAKLSAAPDVESYRIKIKEGILKDTSIGYAITDDGECTGARDGMPIYKFKFSIHEASLVTIPADITVGVGRQRGAESNSELQEISVQVENHIDPDINKEHTTKQPSQPNMKITLGARKFFEADKGGGADGEGTVNVVLERKDAVKKFQEQCKRIDEWVEKLSKLQWKESAREIAAKHKAGDANFDEFRAEALNSFDGFTRIDTPLQELGMSKKEIKRYSLARAIYLRGMGEQLEGIEKEASDATAKMLNKRPDGFFIPEDVQRMSLQEAHGIGGSEITRQLEIIRQIAGMQTRNLLAGNFASAGALIGVDLISGSLIELLRNKQLFATLGTTVLSGLQGNVAIPRQSGGATAYWLAEGASVTESDQQFQQVGLTPKRLVAQTAYDKQLVAQASISIEAMVRNDIALVMAIKKDLAILTGAGSAGEPLGILNTTGVQTVTFSAAATWAKILEFETDLATQNADQTGTPVFLTSPSVRGKWKAITKISTSQYSDFLWEKGDMINGYKGYVSNQIPATGTNANLVYYGVPQEIIDAIWAGIDVVVNPFSLDSSGQIRTTITQFCDIALRHAPAWVVSTDSGAQ